MDGAEWLRTQLTSFGCAACGQAYDAGRIRVLAERDGLYFVDLACSHCGSQAVAIVTIQLDDEHGPQAEVAELPALEAGPIAAPVSADDVLDVHRLLDDADDMDELLRRLGGGPAPAAR
jgi:hypothetical protein